MHSPVSMPFTGLEVRLCASSYSCTVMAYNIGGTGCKLLSTPCTSSSGSGGGDGGSGSSGWTRCSGKAVPAISSTHRGAGDVAHNDGRAGVAAAVALHPAVLCRGRECNKPWMRGAVRVWCDSALGACLARPHRSTGPAGSVTTVLARSPKRACNKTARGTHR